MVLEADESDRSFLRFEPEIAVVTNIEIDHHTTYSSLGDLERAFDEFLALVPETARRSSGSGSRSGFARARARSRTGSKRES